jgi:glycosyltransferase involved in cell wall biosynthesis
VKTGFLVSSISREAGGLSQSVRGLAKALMSINVAVDVFAIEDRDSAADTVKWHPVPVHAFPPLLRAWGYSKRLLPSLLDADLDVLSTHGLWKYSSVASHQWHQRLGRPYIIHPHGMLDAWALRHSQWKKRIAGTLYENGHLRGAACLRALCDSEAQSIRAYGLRNPICVIPNGIDLPKLTEGSELSVEGLLLRVGQSRKILLYLGRVHPKKNLVALLKAWAIAQKPELSSQESEEWLLVIAGWDQRGYEGELKRLSRELGLSFLDLRNQTSEIRNGGSVSSQEIAVRTAATTRLPSGSRHLTSVIFLGPQFGADKDACYRRCDAFVLPSLSEGLPMAVLEAWAHAKAVMMTPECNLPGGVAAGAAIEIGIEATEIARGLTQLFGMAASDRKEMGARGRALVAEKFSWPRIGEQMGAVYEWVLGGGAPPEMVRVD